MLLRRSGDDDRRLVKRVQRWQQRRAQLVLDVLPTTVPPGPRSADLIVRWWWHDGPRTVLVGGCVVSMLRPQLHEPSRQEQLEIGPHTSIGVDHLLVVGRQGSGPGRVEAGSDVTLRLSELSYPGPELPEPAPPGPPAALATLGDHEVVCSVEGGERVALGGLHRVEGTEELPTARGRLTAATAVDGHVVLVLDDGTVLVLHEPLTVSEVDGAVRLAGDLGRVVLDLPSGEAHAARDAALVVRPASTS